VKAIAPHPFVVERPRQRIGVVLERVPAMEGGVETRHLRRIGERTAGGPDTCHTMRLM